MYWFRNSQVCHSFTCNFEQYDNKCKLNCFWFPYQNKLPKVHRRPRSSGCWIWCFVLNLWLIQAGESGECPGLCPGCSHPRKAPAEKPSWLWAPWVSVDPRQVSVHRKVTSLRMDFSGQGRSSVPVAPQWFALSSLSQACLTLWDCPPQFSLSALLLWSVHSVLMLFPGSGMSGMGAARAEEPWRCSACLEWLDTWITALLIQGDWGHRRAVAPNTCSAVSGLFPLLFRAQLFPASTPPPK